MSLDQSCRKPTSFSADVDGAQTLHEVKPQSTSVDSTDLNGFSLHSQHADLKTEGITAHGSLNVSQFADLTFPLQNLPEEDHMIPIGEHPAHLFTNPNPDSNPSVSNGLDLTARACQDTPATGAPAPLNRLHNMDEPEEGSQDSLHDGHNSLEDNMSDDFGLSTAAPGDNACLSKFKETKADSTPAWSELKTKAGKERKRLPLACIACRRKKIRCSGEKPACKHCLRSRIPCVYKVTTRKAAPRTDYMAMLDKRLKRMEDRIIKIVPKCEQDSASSNVVWGVVKPVLPGSLSQNKQSGKKRAVDEAFGTELENWAHGSMKPRSSSQNKPPSLQVHDAEDNKLLSEGAASLPPKEIQEHLAEVFFDNIYGQAYHLLHKPSYIRKLKAGTLPPVLVLSVCAVSARFSTHPMFAMTNNFLRGEDWAAPARDIVIRRYEWPNITILTCLLLLGLHEFGTCHGGRSWSLGGQATRMAYALQLHKDLEYDPMRPDSSNRLSFIDREIRRRTMWACFLMDRFNSSGTDRPMFVREETIRLQLPIKEKLFQLDMPGPTEDLEGRVLYPVPADDGQLSDAKDNMGVAAYMIRAIALWGRIISFLNQGGKEVDEHSMWDTNSRYASLLKQAEDFPSKLPEGLEYSAENLHLHKTEGMVNQFLFLHISVQQNILFMNRFAVSSPNGSLQADVPQTFVTQAGSRAFAAANKISELLKDAEAYVIAAPFVGYCAFLSSTVHIFGVFSGNAAVEVVAKRHLTTNIKFLTKMKRYWAMFHFMAENLREQYNNCADAARKGTSANDKPTASPIFQYGDWFDRYPHGVSQPQYVEPAPGKKAETGDDAVLEQRPVLHTVEEFFTQLSPPSSTNEGQDDAGTNRAPFAKRRSVAVKGANARIDQAQQHESLFTELNGTNLPEQIQPPTQQVQQQHVPRNFALGPQTNGSPSSYHHSSNARALAATTYPAMSPVSPAVGGFAHGLYGHGQQYPGVLYNSDVFSSAANSTGFSPQLDRQLLFNAYGGLDPTTISGPEALMDWDALAGHASNANGAHTHEETVGYDNLPSGFVPDPSPAWFVPFNMEQPQLSQETGNGVADTFGVFSPRGSFGLRRSGH
ncbi:fungal-specific transcription factor [Xylaria nigripes]|nr:fungal-specific transcription factor [Xylaria nigripes]